MRLNLENCTFDVRVWKFLGLNLTERGIKVNHDKCEAVVRMSAPTSMKEVQKLNVMLTPLNMLISKSS